MIDQWLSENDLDFHWKLDQRVFSIQDKNYVIIKPKKDILFDENFDIILDDEELSLMQEYDCKFYSFKFGTRFYYSDIAKDTVEFKELKYIGQSKTSGFMYLGIHGGYELCNGSRAYKDWCKKAKFLGIDTLGICEYNTLAGVLQFQLDCKSNNIKPIIGETVLVKNEHNYTYRVKLYCIDDKGWNNLLWINKIINVDNVIDKHIKESQLLERLNGLVVVLGSDLFLTEDVVIEKYKQCKVFYQIDPVKWKSNDKDQKHLLNIKNFYDKFYAFVSPIFICDSYYLDKQDNPAKETLNKIGKISPENQSDDQYFKNFDECVGEIYSFFKNKPEQAEKFIDECVRSLDYVQDWCQFSIDTKSFHLPQYTLTEQEQSQYADKEELFWALIEQGISLKVVEVGKDVEVYLNRIDVEFDVIKRGGFVDYFLILSDVVRWCDSQNILVGAGRGSAAGSLIAYLLGLVKIDPIEYDLIFERFLNEGRIGKGLPDVDTDIAGNRRDEVKRYMEQRYGIDNVCSIGTYGTFKTKAILRDLCRLKGISPATVNYYAAMIEDSNSDFIDLFKEVVKSERLKEFIQENYEIVNEFPLFLGQPKTSSIHAAGVIITPSVDKNGKPMTIYDWIPVKSMNGILISEWEGPQLESAGYLKEDILGIRQLDKFADIFKLIEQSGKQAPSLDNIDVNDKEVYKLFKLGLNQDLFHFGSLGLTQYSQQLKPDNFEELIAMIAAYRPGAMEFGAHEDMVKIKFGKKDPEYDYNLKEVTQSTFGLYLYQEQVMKACQVLGGFSLTEADDIRKAMGKKILEKLQGYKNKFIQGAVANKCSELEAQKIWNKLEAFAGYGFNRSHAAAYAITGYFCQWLKLHYPIEFWTVSLQYADEDEIPGRINEISRLQNIKILAPDINKSQLHFTLDIEANSIYWSIGKIKQVGPVALETIIGERNTNGPFYSLSEFCSRINGRKVNRRCVANLITAGCFDIIENLKSPRDRKTLLVKYYQTIREEVPNEYLVAQSSNEWFWYLQQKNVSGSGIFEFESLLSKIHIDNIEALFCPPEVMLLDDNVGRNAVIVGVVKEVIEKKSKKGLFAQLVLDHNNAQIEATLWNESWEEYKEILTNSEGSIVAVSGLVVADKWRKHNVLHSQTSTIIQII